MSGRSSARWPDCATGWHDRCTEPRCGCPCHTKRAAGHDVSNLRHRIELAIIGRTAPRAADAVMAVLAELEFTIEQQQQAEREKRPAETQQDDVRKRIERGAAVAMQTYEAGYAAALAEQFTEEQWQAERDDPEAGHTFRIEAHSRGSYAVITEDGTTSPHTDAEWMPEHPFVIEVRAWNLRDAMAKAAHLPLPLWRLTP